MKKIFNFQFSIFNKNLQLTTYNLQLNSGFTLIELLIVIAILAGLAAIFMTTFPGAQAKARDGIRKSDIKQYQTAMEVYANKTDGDYLATGGTVNPSSKCSDLGLSNCPNDPKGSPYVYQMNSTLTQYVIYATLEVLDDSVTPAVTQYFVACSNGQSGRTTTMPSGSNCPGGLKI